MGKIVDIKYISDKVNDDSVIFIANCLNDGYEILKFETGWVKEGTDNVVNSVPMIIAILIKREG